MKEKIKKAANNLLDKKNYKLQKMILLFVLSIVLSTLIEKLVFSVNSGNFSLDRIIIMIGCMLFAGLHAIFKLKDMYEWIYKKRFILSGVFLAFVVIMEYSGSSISNYNYYIQSESTDSTYMPIFGKPRSIRSDEWAVNTPLTFSQASQDVKYPYFNLNIRGTKTDMFTIINSPVNDVVTIGKIFNIGYLLFGNEKGLSFWWYGRLIALMLVSFEFCMLLTKKNKLFSLFGMLLITFSPAVQWWYSNFIADILIWGQLALVLIDKFMITKNKRIKYLSLIGIGICAISYVFTFYPAWMISFAYVYLAIFIWIILKNRKVYKINKKDVIAILITIIIVGLLLLRFFLVSKDTLNLTLNTDYPGARFESGGGAEDNMFSYVYSMLMPFQDIGNSSEYSNMLSLYPLPMIISILFLWKKRKDESFKKHCTFLIPILLVSILFSFWVFVPFNRLIAKITLLYMIPTHRVAISLGYSQIILILYLLKNITNETKLIKKEVAFLISGFITTIALSISVNTIPADYLGPVIGFVLGTIIFVLFYLMFNFNKEKHKYYFITIMLGVVLISGAIVNPILKDTNVIYDKPVAKKIQSIVSEDKEALWLVDNLNFTIPNFVIANGAKVINSTNYYPNHELYEVLLGEESKKEEVRKIYNRYAHISVNIDNVDTNLELLYPDAFKINLNPSKLKDINVKYILSSRDLQEYSDSIVKFNKIYDEFGCYIFEVIY